MIYEAMETLRGHSVIIWANPGEKGREIPPLMILAHRKKNLHFSQD